MKRFYKAGIISGRTSPDSLLKFLLSFVLLGSLYGCSGLFFFPMREHLLNPEELGLDFQDVSLTTADGTPLHAWFLPISDTPRGTILFLHGNAENISTHIHNVRWLPEAGYQVLLLDYRGFGKSNGRPNLPGVFLDIDAAYNWLATSPQTAGDNLYILGQSIGASLILHRVPRYDSPNLCALISDAAFTRYGDIIRHVAKQSWLTWPLQYPLSWSFGSQYDPIDALPLLDTLPILFFHSADDQVIPPSNLDQLLATHSGPHRRIVTRGPHTATFNREENRSHLLNFLAEHRCASRPNLPRTQSRQQTK